MNKTRSNDKTLTWRWEWIELLKRCVKKHFRQWIPSNKFMLQIEVLLRAVNLQHGTQGFTPLPKEVILMIFTLWKNPSAPAGFEPANLGSSDEYENHGTTVVDSSGVQHLCTFNIVAPFLYHLLPNVWKASYTISELIFVDVPYWPPYSTDKFISCVVLVKRS